MKLLPFSFDIRVMLYARAPLAALKSLDAPGIAVCDVVRKPSEVPRRAAQLCPHVLVLADGAEEALADRICQAQPLVPPRLVCRIPAEGLADAVRRVMLEPCSVLAQDSIPRRELLAQDSLREIGMSPRLRGFECIARGAALLSATPSPLPPLQYGIYPILAQELGVAPASVEKRIRGAIESAWLHGNLAAQNRLLGLSVSAERGKPTNSELLCRLAGRICETLYTL
ncbi:MAG: sporulation initiation factor Spo0A C-terminal domain-containing protein [Clostridia bacterium]|nr:sporulation initiation factor Spo0A C-terminal domain-containing protein [Clostridia bacterium]